MFCSFRVLAEIGNPARLLARVSADGADAGSPEKCPGALSALDVPLPFPVESGFVSVELRHRYSPQGCSERTAQSGVSLDAVER